MQPVKRATPLLSVVSAAVVAVAALLTGASTADAKPPIVRAWAQAHGTLANGQARFFSAERGPYVGYGGQIGLALTYIEVFYDANVFDRGTDPGERSATMWNQLGGGINVPIEVGKGFSVFGRADIAWVWAPFDGGPGSGDTGGVATRGGAGVDYAVLPFLTLGTALYGGYNVFGARDRGDNGSYLMGQLYTRFDIGF